MRRISPINSRPRAIQRLSDARESCSDSTERCGEITIIMAVHDRPPLVNGAFNASTLRAAADHLHLDKNFQPVVVLTSRELLEDGMLLSKKPG